MSRCASSLGSSARRAAVPLHTIVASLALGGCSAPERLPELRTPTPAAPEPAEPVAPPTPSVTVPPFRPLIGDQYEVSASMFLSMTGSNEGRSLDATVESSAQGVVTVRAVEEGRITEASVIVTRSRLIVAADGEVESELRTSQEEFVVFARDPDAPRVATLTGWGPDDTDTMDALSLMDVGTTDDWRRESRTLLVGEAAPADPIARSGTTTEVRDMMSMLLPSDAGFEIRTFEKRAVLQAPTARCDIPFALTYAFEYAIETMVGTATGTGTSCTDSATGLTIHEDDQLTVDMQANGDKIGSGQVRVKRTLSKR